MLPSEKNFDLTQNHVTATSTLQLASPPPKPTIKCAHSKKSFEYEIMVGLTPSLVVDMQTKWGLEKIKIMTELMQKHPEAASDVNVFLEKLPKYSLEDFRWDWQLKVFMCQAQANAQEYLWFYLVADGCVQAASIIYHPKTSRFDKADIFYVDYLATAYWNRDRPDYVRRFSGLGPILLSHSLKHSIDVLGYRPGFSLHSLRGAENFYLGLGMQDFGIDPSKENLRYFEASEVTSRKILKDANDRA